MRIVRIVVIILFVGTVIAAGVLHFTNVADATVPVITCSAKTIEAPCSVTDAQLLSYVTAYDEKDGKLTDKIIVEGVSKFIEIGMANVTYAVCDSDNNVAKLTRRIIYTDYRAPRIYLKDSFIFTIDEKNASERESINLLEHIGASDLFDGDISRKITIIASDFDGNSTGRYSVTFKVANSMGDYSIVTYDAFVYSDTFTEEIIADNYTKFITVGEKLNPADFVKEIDNIKSGNESETFTKGDVTIDASGLKTSVPGVYNIFYTIKNPDNNRIIARSRISVVCEEK